MSIQKIKKCFANTKFIIDQYIGFNWQPESKEAFFVYDIREITESRSGIIKYEYKMARYIRNSNDGKLAFTDWISDDKMFLLDIQEQQKRLEEDKKFLTNIL